MLSPAGTVRTLYSGRCSGAVGGNARCGFAAAANSSRGAAAAPPTSKKPSPIVLKNACKMGLEGIVSKRKDSAYRSGRSPDWLKMKNPACTAVKRSGGTGGQARSGGG